MVKRPFRDRRPLGPFVSSSASGNSSQNENQDPTFQSLDDLPDSPMLREYVNKQAEYLNKDVDEVINSKPVKDYMKRLGVWEQALEQNS